MLCENCKNEHNGAYGSGRFCSAKCARSFATKANRTEINSKLSKRIKTKLENGETVGFAKPTKSKTKCICRYCLSEFYSKNPNQQYCSITCSKKAIGWSNSHNNLTKEDWSRINKKTYETGKNFVAGGTTKWFDYNGLKVQGSYELRTCQILDIWKKYNVIKDWEYTKDSIQYIGVDGKLHTYLLDFKVYTNQNFFYYIEVKGYETETDTLKWKAVRENGNRLDVWFEKDILKIEKEIGLRGC